MKKNHLYLGWFIFANTNLLFLPIQIQIHLGVPKLSQYEYKYNFVDWYLKIQILIWIHSTQKKNYMLMNLNAIKVCKLTDICAIIWDLSYWIEQEFKYNILWFSFMYIQLNSHMLPTSAHTDAATYLFTRLDRV